MNYIILNIYHKISLVSDIFTHYNFFYVICIIKYTESLIFVFICISWQLYVSSIDRFRSKLFSYHKVNEGLRCLIIYLLFTYWIYFLSQLLQAHCWAVPFVDEKKKKSNFWMSGLLFTFFYSGDRKNLTLIT